MHREQTRSMSNKVKFQVKLRPLLRVAVRGHQQLAPEVNIQVKFGAKVFLPNSPPARSSLPGGWCANQENVLENEPDDPPFLCA